MSSGILETSGLQASALLLAVSEISRVLRHQTRDVPYFRWLGVVSAGHPPFLNCFLGAFRSGRSSENQHAKGRRTSERLVAHDEFTAGNSSALQRFQVCVRKSPSRDWKRNRRRRKQSGEPDGVGGCVRDELLSSSFCGKIKPTTTNCWLEGVRRASPTYHRARKRRTQRSAFIWMGTPRHCCAVHLTKVVSGGRFGCVAAEIPQLLRLSLSLPTLFDSGQH